MTKTEKQELEELRKATECLPHDAEGNLLTPGMHRWGHRSVYSQYPVIIDTCQFGYHPGVVYMHAPEGSGAWPEFTSNLYGTKEAAANAPVLNPFLLRKDHPKYLSVEETRKKRKEVDKKS